MSKKFWIKKQWYMKQVGDDMPHLIEASPDRPVLVTLPDNTKPCPDLYPVKEDLPPEASKPEKAAVAAHASHHVPSNKLPEKKSGKRAADE